VQKQAENQHVNIISNSADTAWSSHDKNHTLRNMNGYYDHCIVLCKSIFEHFTAKVLINILDFIGEFACGRLG
jgi:hypothetical protein